MKISLFYEFPLPRPWAPDDEHKLFQDGLDEVELADKAGFSTVWLTEHHFLEEYCHSTAPEIFLAAASQRTKNIRLGFGIMHLPPVVNHPARVAETGRDSRSRLERPGGVRDRGIVVGGRARRIRDRPRRQARYVGRGPGSLDPVHDRGAVHRLQGPARRNAAPQRDSQAAAEAAPAGVGRLHPAGLGADGRAKRTRRVELRLHRTRAARGASQRLLQGVRGERRTRHSAAEPQHPCDRRRPVDDGRAHRRASHRTARSGWWILLVRHHALLHDRDAHARTNGCLEAPSRRDREGSERRVRPRPRTDRQSRHGA